MTVVSFRKPALEIGCSACGATVDAACDCGAPYIPARQRVPEFDAANPGKSTRQVADALGLSQTNVVKARKNSREQGCSPERVTGADGKSYPAARPDNDDITADAEHAEGLRVIAARGFLNRAAEAKEIATLGKLQASDVTEAMIKAADDAAAAWSTAARNLRRMIAHV
jgi:hypothetical protein